MLVLGASAARPAQEPEAASGAPGLRYEIWVELDAAGKMLLGKEELVWTNPTKDTVPDMLLHLYWNAFKNEDSAFLREAAAETMFGDGDAPDDGEWGWIDVTDIRLADGTDLKPGLQFVTPDGPDHPGDQTVARILFPAPVEPGESVRLRLEFRSKIPRTVARAGYYRNSFFIAQWFPKPGIYEEGRGWNAHAYHQNSEFFADFADFVVHITVPRDFVVGSSGKQIDERIDGPAGTKTLTYSQAMVHDFAWMADPRYLKIEREFVADREVTPQEYRETAELLGLPFEEVRLPNVKMTLLIAPEHKGQIERHFRALRAAIKYYGLWYGPYPYETVTMVDPPFRTGSGGMEYPTLFTAGTRVLPSKNQLSPEGVIVHEFGHGYWYGLAANNEFEEAWLDEGINTYSTGRVQGKAYGPGMFSASLFGWPLTWLINFPRYLDFELDRLAAIMTAERDPVTTPSWLFSSRMSYAMNVYMRASTGLNTLERFLGEATMLRVMRTFQMRFRFRHPRTPDFIDVVNEVSGQDLIWFFEELFFTTHNFDYGVSRLRTEEKKDLYLGVFEVDGRKEEIKQKDLDKDKKRDREKKEGQKTYVTDVTVRRFGEAVLGGEARVKLRVVFEDGSEEVRHWDGRDRWENFRFENPAKAKSAEIDPDLIWLIDSNLSNNSLKAKPSKGGVTRLASRLLFWVQNYLHYLSALS
ncbi:MAG TPA: hypothetical protein DIW61_10665 [Candidatus Aminicenantes bacterium]|nr:hypothetical protein [Candidatus Aminicenantes bacterium]